MTGARSIDRRWVLAGFAAIAVASLLLRLWQIRHGLPAVYNRDEERHFVRIAAEMFNNGLNPGYFHNPSGLTYLLNATYRVVFLTGFPFGTGQEFVASFHSDPAAAFTAGRVVVALFCTGAVAATFALGRRLASDGVGLIGAAVLAFSFLPAFYSRLALNDVPTMTLTTLALLLVLRAWDTGRRREWLVAGGAIGLAIGFKYTAGLMLLPLTTALALRVRSGHDSWLNAARSAAAALAACVAVFLLLNPFALIDFGEFSRQFTEQRQIAGEIPKIGQDDVPGWLYFAESFTWGLGWAPLLAALAGAVLLARRDWRLALLTLLFPLALLAFMGAQAQVYARFLLPAYPVLACMAALALVEVARSVSGARPKLRAALLVAGVVVLCAQGVWSNLHVGRVLGKTDTRVLAREWLAREVPFGGRVVFEPFFPNNFFRDAHWLPFPSAPRQDYQQSLEPGLIDVYRRNGFCVVLVGTEQKGRGLKEGLDGAVGYYERLDRESRLARVISPFAPGFRPPEFDFDQTYNYLPAAYERPGPLIEIHRLTRCRENPRR